MKRVGNYGIIVLLFVILMLVLFAGRQNQDVRSRAALPTPTPFIIRSVPAANAKTIPPYIRLVLAEETADNIAFDIYTHTGGIAVMEVRTALRYNEETLAITKDAIKTLGALPIQSVNRLSAGILDVSFFADAEAGHRLLQTNGDELVARLVFAKNGQQGPRSIQLLKEDSGLYVQAGETAKNILNSVEDIEFP